MQTASPRGRALRARRRRIWEEQLLPVYLVVGDRLLAVGRDEPVDELLAVFLLHVRALLGIHQQDAILVEQPPVAFYHDREVAAVLEREPGAPVGEYVGIGGARSVERGAHALADRLVPGAGILLGIDACRLPQRKLRRMRPRLVAARNERSLLRLDRFQRSLDVLASAARRTALLPDQ